MRRLLALGLGCLASFTASSEDLLTIFDQAVVNDPRVREAEFTRQATREARPRPGPLICRRSTAATTRPRLRATGRQSARSSSKIPAIRLDSSCSSSGRTVRLLPEAPAGTFSCARPSSTGAAWLRSSNPAGSRPRPMRTMESRNRTWRCGWPPNTSTCSPRWTTCRHNRQHSTPFRASSSRPTSDSKSASSPSPTCRKRAPRATLPRRT